MIAVPPTVSRLVRTVNRAVPDAPGATVPTSWRSVRGDTPSGVWSSTATPVAGAEPVLR